MICGRQVIAIIFAGGSGKRLHESCADNFVQNLPKQFLDVNGCPILIHTLNIFQQNDKVDKIYIATHKDYVEYTKELVEKYKITKIAGITIGADTALGSQYNALKLAEQENPANSIVLIHDGVRPNVAQKTLENVINGTLENGNAITCTSCFETALISADGKKVDNVPYRKNAFMAQAPQGFLLDELLQAHDAIRKTNPKYDDIVDCCTMYKTLEKPVFMVPGNRGNIKITTIEDLYLLRGYIRYKEDKMIAEQSKMLVEKYENKDKK